MAFKPKGRLQGAFVNDCRTLTDTEIIERWIFRETPYGFRDSRDQFMQWRKSLADCLGVNEESVLISGSVAAGLSFSPNKSLRHLRPDSDVDICVISAEFFQKSWDWLVGTKVERIQFARDVVTWIEEHQSRLIFYGQIASDQYLEVLPFGKRWIDCLNRASSASFIAPRELKTRIYKDKQCLVNYLRNGLRNLRENLGI